MNLYSRLPRFWVVVFLCAVAVGCQPPVVVTPQLGPPLHAVRGTEPDVRIRVVQSSARVEIEGASGVKFGALHEVSASRIVASPVTVTRRRGAFEITTGSARPSLWPQSVLALEPAAGATLRVNGINYPRKIVLVCATAEQDATGRFDVVNHTPLEEYLPGVLDREFYAKWHPNAFAAQAVAARSYALFSSNKNRERHYDMEATAASQAYSGAVSNIKAIEAVRITRGLVLTWDDRVLPAYYSSSTGGTGQDANFAFADGTDIPPLKGTLQSTWDGQAKYYRWGPINRPRMDLARRIAEWGRANNNPIAALHDLREIEITAHNAVGRPARFTLTDTNGHRYNLMPEQFRFACNYGSPTLPEPATLHSSHVSVRVVGNVVQFWDGRGYGHGVGLSQWGAEAMAEAGQSYQGILAFYYPGAKLERLY